MISTLPFAGGLASANAQNSDYVNPYLIYQRIIELFKVENLGSSIESIPDDIEQILVIHPKERIWPQK